MRADVPAAPAAATTRRVWVKASWLGVLLIVAYWPVLTGMVGNWFDHASNMGHGILVPPAVGIIVWRKREALRDLEDSPRNWGLLLVLWGVVQAIVGLNLQWRFVSRTALLVSLFGCLLYLRGKATVRELAFPLLVLLFMIAPPTFVYERITLPLQLIASSVAERMLEFLGYSVLRDGNVLELAGRRLSVAEACSGLRSLVTVAFFFVVYGYFFVPRISIRLVLIAATVPIAILSNGLRVASATVVAEFDPVLAFGALHEASGHVALLFAIGLCVLCHRALENIHRRLTV